MESLYKHGSIGKRECQRLLREEYRRGDAWTNLLHDPAARLLASIDQAALVKVVKRRSALFSATNDNAFAAAIQCLGDLNEKAILPDVIGALHKSSDEELASLQRSPEVTRLRS
jgi:hypothetical protein